MNTVEVGTVTRAHGIRGELRVRLHWEASTVLGEVEAIWLVPGRGAAERFEVVSARPATKGVIVRLAGVDSREAAEALRGRPVHVERDALPAAEPGEYYLCDLVGAHVVGPEGHVGEVVEIRVHPSVDALVVRTPDGKLLEQPLVEPWIGEVDVVGRRVTLTTTDGMV